MNPLFASAHGLQAFFQTKGWRFCFIGGLAVQRWGEPRLTLDVDGTVLTGFGAEASYIEDLLAAFPGRVPDAGAFALRYRVLLLHGPLGIPADIALGALPFEQRCVERATPFAIGGDQTILTCSAEDLVVLKAFAGRPRDWLDIEGIVLRQGAALNRQQIVDEVTPLLALKDDEVSGPRLTRVLETLRDG